MFMYTFVLVYIYIPIYIYTYTDICVYIYMYICIYVYVSTYIYTYIYVYVYIYICIHTYIHVCIYTSIRTLIHTHIHMHTHAYTHTRVHTPAHASPFASPVRKPVSRSFPCEKNPSKYFSFMKKDHRQFCQFTENARVGSLLCAPSTSRANTSGFFGSDLFESLAQKLLFCLPKKSLLYIDCTNNLKIQTSRFWGGWVSLRISVSDYL